MQDFLIAVVVLLLYMAAACGWGRFVLDRLPLDVRPGPAFATTFGFGIWIFVGGLLNALRLAFPLALDSMLVLGLLSALFTGARSLRGTPWLSGVLGRRPGGAPPLDSAPAAAFIGTAALYLALSQMPSRAFNYHDDFCTYLTRPLRMLQTGTLGGNLFDLLGTDSLGSQAFMQSFFVDILGVDYVNGFDTVSCFVLGLCLLHELSRRLEAHWMCALAAGLLFTFIHPQIVNVSSLYSGSLMALAAISSCILFADAITAEDARRSAAGAAIVGLFLAALVSLKMTYAPFAAAFYLVFAGLSIWSTNARRATARAMVQLGLSALVALGPWLWLTMPNYLRALRVPSPRGGEVVQGVGSPGLGLLQRAAIAFSARETFWGGRYLTYSAVASLLLVTGVVSLAGLRSRDPRVRQRAAPLAAACFAAVLTFVLNIQIVDPNLVARYSAPILIAVASAAAILIIRRPWNPPEQGWPARDRSFHPGSAAVLGVAVLIALAFAGDFATRCRRGWQLRTQLSFGFLDDPRSLDAYMTYNESVLRGALAGRVRALQNETEEGEAILATVATPFQFDFARNPVHVLNEGSFFSPWCDLPLRGGPEVARRYLLDRGIRYVMFQTRGFGIRSDGDYAAFARSPFQMYRRQGEANLEYRKILRDLSAASRVVARSAGLVLIDISGRPRPDVATPD